MGVFWYFIELIMCGIETGIVFTLCYKSLGINKRFNFSHVLIMAGAISAITWGATCIAPYSWWKTLLSVILLAIFIISAFDKKIKERVLHFALSVGLLLLSDIIATALISWSQSAVTWQAVLSPTIDRLATYAIAKVIMSFIVALLIHSKNDSVNLLPAKYWLLFLFAFSLMIIGVLLFMDIGFSVEANEWFNAVVVSLILILLVLYLLVYFFYYQICNFFAERNAQNLLEYQNDMIEKYMIQKQGSDNMVKILNHDLKQHLQIWRQSLEEHDCKDALASVIEYEKTLANQKLIDVGNEMANALLNQKIFVAHAKNIRFSVQGVIHNDIMISQLDFFALLGNLLDNAIEAAEKVDRSDIRYVDVVITRDKRFLLLEIENSYAEAPVTKNGSLISSKKNRSAHGIGILSINHVLSKHVGNMIQTYENGVFKTIVGLRVYTR